MGSSEAVLVVAVFLASAVEMVEALTIVLAVGTTRGWRSAFEGVAAALFVLTAWVVALGPALVRYVPLHLLRAVVGGVLLIFGLQWLRKAILRAAGMKEKRNEDLVYRSTVAELQRSPHRGGRDKQGFVISFKGVFIEGLEVIIIVLTLGSSAHDLGLAAVSALAAALIVTAAGLVVARQLSGVPENTMKLVVGLMLVSFGTFWGGEGLGIKWPGSDLTIPVLVLAYGILTFIVVKMLSRSREIRVPRSLRAAAQVLEIPSRSGEVATLRPVRVMPLRIAEGFIGFWWDFLIGDTPELFAGTMAIFGATELGLRATAPPIYLVLGTPVLVMALLGLTVAIGYRGSAKR